jgi:hypothetical protein
MLSMVILNSSCTSLLRLRALPKAGRPGLDIPWLDSPRLGVSLGRYSLRFLLPFGRPGLRPVPDFPRLAGARTLTLMSFKTFGFRPRRLFGDGVLSLDGC